MTYLKSLGIMVGLAIGIVLLGTVLVLGISLLSDVRDAEEPLEFDQDAWVVSGRGSDVRYQMALSIERDRSPIGQTRTEVLEVLGVPETEDSVGLHYALGGPTSFAGGFQNILTIQLRDDRVADAFVRQD